MIYGYARVSTASQDHASQVSELTAAGCEQVFAEVKSGKAGSRRPQLTRALAALAPGDALIVVQLNRLARSARDALNLIAAVSAKGAAFKSLREAWADTTTPHGRLMVTLWCGLAEFDREQIIARTGEGRAAAKARGVRMGRKPTLTRTQTDFVRQAVRTDPPMSIGELVKLLGVSRSTICRAIAGAEGGEGRQLDLEAAIAQAGPPGAGI